MRRERRKGRMEQENRRHRKSGGRGNRKTKAVNERVRETKRDTERNSEERQMK